MSLRDDILQRCIRRRRVAQRTDANAIERGTVNHRRLDFDTSNTAQLLSDGFGILQVLERSGLNVDVTRTCGSGLIALGGRRGIVSNRSHRRGGRG